MKENIVYIDTIKYLSIIEIYFIFVITLQKNWHEAFTICKQNGMQLLNIETKEENDAIVHELKTAFGNYHIPVSCITFTSI
jgi:hypothetical protein